MALNSTHYLILQVLANQSDGYLCGSSASAFIAEGLDDPGQVELFLIELQEQGLVEFFIENEELTVLMVERDEQGSIVYEGNGKIAPILDNEGNVQTEVIVTPVDSGWIITAAGRTELTNA